MVALDTERTWFRHHHLFADLLALELRRTTPQELPGLHTIAAEWLAAHGHPVEVIRHARDTIAHFSSDVLPTPSARLA